MESGDQLQDSSVSLWPAGDPPPIDFRLPARLRLSSVIRPEFCLPQL